MHTTYSQSPLAYFWLTMALLASALLSVSTVTNANSQSTTASWPENVYAIELVVFERTGSAFSADAEQWPKNLVLKYPNYWRRLIDPVQEAKRKAHAKDENSEWVLPAKFLHSLAPTQTDNTEHNLTPDEKLKTDASLLSSKQEAEPDEDGSLPEGVALPNLFEFVPKKERFLLDSARAINRDKSLRVLFHQKWLQPLTQKSEAPALIIQGGNQFGAHHELEGSITIHLSRYLHLSTNLWLTQFISNRGQQSDHWPNLPAPPNEQEALLARLTQDLNLSAADFAQANNANLSTLAINLENQDGEVAQRAGYLQTPPNSPVDLSQGVGTLADQAPQLNTSSPYLINQIVTLNQSRRMRSDETHYIDHPKVGLLIRVTPYKLPEADESLTAELNETGT